MKMNPETAKATLYRSLRLHVMSSWCKKLMMMVNWENTLKVFCANHTICFWS